MLDKARKIIRTPLFRAGSLNGISVLIKIAAGLLTSKLVAVFVGPSGMALLGNMRNFLTTAEGLLSLGFQNGIVKYVTESRENASEFKKIISTLTVCFLVASGIGMLLLFAFAHTWSQSVFLGDDQYANVFRIMALALPCYVGSIYLLSVLNGLGKYRKVIYTNIIGNITSLVFSVVLVWQYELKGALLSMVVAPAFLLLVTVYYVGREMGYEMISFSHFDFKIVRNLSGFALMNLVSYLMLPMVFLAIRNELIQNSGMQAAGYWEGISRISSYYMLFVVTLLGVYFFPKLTLAENDKQLGKVFKSYFKGVLPIFGAGLILVYLLRYYIIQLVFTQDFQPMESLFFWQLLGDFLKAASLVLGYCFFAKKLTTAFVVTEVFSMVLMYFSSLFLLKNYGALGVVAAHCFTYAAYLLVLLVYFRKSLFAR